MASTVHQKRWLTLLPLLLFVGLGSTWFWNAMGDDLASSYVGCQVLATAQGGALYSHDPVNFAGMDEADRVWPQLAAKAHYTGYLHPYVQTPLWAALLRPLCGATSWQAFKHLFLVLALASIAGCIGLVAWFWTPGLFKPLPITLVLCLLSVSTPFVYAMGLVQTHALLLLLTVAGLILAERGRPVAGGFCVALAAAVKITPGILLLYWLAGRRWRAAISLVLTSAALLIVTRFAAGAALFDAYRDSMLRVSHVLLVAENNQSFAATLMGHHFAADEVFDVNAFALPAVVRQLSTALMIAFTILSGLLDAPARAAQDNGPTQGKSGTVPYGAGIALIAMTAFAPIAWTHYSIVLVLPLMMLADTALRQRSRAPAARSLWAVILLASALLFRPFAPDVVHMDLSDLAVLRGTFFSGMLCLGALLGSAWWQQRTLKTMCRDEATTST